MFVIVFVNCHTHKTSRIKWFRIKVINGILEFTSIIGIGISHIVYDQRISGKIILMKFVIIIQIQLGSQFIGKSWIKSLGIVSGTIHYTSSYGTRIISFKLGYSNKAVVAFTEPVSDASPQYTTSVR